jgi:hypothetical protein
MADLTPDPKPAARIVDRDALAVARLRGDECVACGRPPGSVHHVIPRGERGDDVTENLLLLCGSGTSGCHGAWHGNPYLVEDKRTRIVESRPGLYERRDADWVAVRIGHHIAASRPDTIDYVFAKLGANPGRAYLLRRYKLEVPDVRRTL